MEKTIEIPEGYKAIIDGNKIILEPKESEDERIRKEIITFLDYYHTGNGGHIDFNPAWIAWLERIGSQNLANSAKTCEVAPKFRVGDMIKFAGQPDRCAEKIITIRNDAYYFSEVVSLPFIEQDKWELVEQNPAWSKEVEAAVNLLKDIAEEQEENHLQYNANNLREAARYLETCRLQNTWKPSDEQINGIKCAIETLRHQLNIGDKRLDSLYNDLKKLKG